MRATILSLLFLSLTAPASEPKDKQQCNFELLITEHQSLEATVPCMNREDLSKVLIKALSRDNQDAAKHLEPVLQNYGDLTLTITTKHRTIVKATP